MNPAQSHIIQHQKPPVRWEDGLPLGNGALGVMIWGDGNPLCLTLDHANLWDLRSEDAYSQAPDFNYHTLQKLVAEKRFAEVDEIFEQRQLRENPIGPTKLSIGRIEVISGEADSYHSELNLGMGKVSGRLSSSNTARRFECFIPEDMDVICLHVESLSDCDISLKLLSEITPSLANLGHPSPVQISQDNLQVLSQEIPDGPVWAVAWNNHGPDYFFAVAVAQDLQQARLQAVAIWKQAEVAGYEKLHSSHQSNWEKFWSEAAVYLPEKEIEFLWYYGLYLLKSASRKDAMPPGLQGVWPMDGVIPPWRGDYHADMNVQETFWPAFSTGHLDLVDNWCNLMLQAIPKAQKFTRDFFGTEGTFWPCCTLPNFTIVPCWHTVQFAWSHGGWLGSLVWLRWRYSMDCHWLLHTGYPIVAEIFKFYRANLKPEIDGFLHIPLSSSPEYKENLPEAWCKDPAIDIALIHRCCNWIIEFETALEIYQLTEDARDIKKRLVPYPVTEANVLCLWPDKPLDISHRHPSHLMAIHPTMELTIEGSDEDRAIISASLEHYFSLGQYLWAGHTYAQMASFGAVTGRGEFAFDCLHRLLEYWLGPNGLHFNRDTRCTGVTAYQGSDAPFTLEANCGAVAGISDMLLQGWNDILRIFPAVPRHWHDLAFSNLLAEGGWRISALLLDDLVQWVKITATTGRKLRMQDPFHGQGIVISGPAVVREENLMSVYLHVGDSLELSRTGQRPVMSRYLEKIHQSSTSRLGLR